MPIATKPRRRSRSSSSGMKKSLTRTRRAWRGSCWIGTMLEAAVGLRAQPLADVGDCRRARRSAGAGRPSRAMRSPARVSSEASASSKSSARSCLVGTRERRAVRHRARRIGPQPDGLRRFPFLIAQEQLGRARRLPPVDPAGGIAGLIRPELPEGLADADPAPPVHALRHGRRHPLGRHQQRRQAVGQYFGLLMQADQATARADAGRRHAATSAHSRWIT